LWRIQHRSRQCRRAEPGFKTDGTYTILYSPVQGEILATSGFLYGVDLGGPSDTGFQVVFQLSTSGSYKELRQTEGCTPKTGCSTVMQASDGNLWIADQRASSV
jgi:hypothetical protein